MTATHSTREVAARKVRAGDYLTGLDNGYVIEVEHEPEIANHQLGGVYARLGDGMVMLTFNTAEGDEGYVIAPPETPVTVRTPREAAIG